MNIAFSPPDITELEINEVVDTLKSGWITTGPKTKLFEKQISEYCKTDCTVCLNSATAALELILRVLNIGEGDEVITSAYTYTASASSIIHAGATPVLVDVKKDSVDMDLELVEKAITDKTKAIIAVDIAGIMCDFYKLIKLAESKKGSFKPNGKIQEALGRIAVIADAAHSIGAVRNGKNSGQGADFTAFSFHAVKNLTTAEGGAATFNKIEGVDCDEIYKQFQLYSLHGQNKDALAKTKLGAWEYDIVGPYFKCNMTDIMASLGLAQLKRYEGILNRRHEIIGAYDKAFEQSRIVPLVHSGQGFRSSGHLYITRISGADMSFRNRFIEKMAEKGISTNVHYKPLCLLTAYKNLGFKEDDYKNAVDFFKNEVTLPLHTLLTDEQVDYVTENALGLLK